MFPRYGMWHGGIFAAVIVVLLTMIAGSLLLMAATYFVKQLVPVLLPLVVLLWIIRFMLSGRA